MKSIVLDVVFLLGLLGAISCGRRIDFTPPPAEEMTVQVTPQWNATTLPSELNVMFYHLDGTLYRLSLLPLTGGQVTLPKAYYRVVLCNPDADQVVVGQEDSFASVMGQINLINQTTDSVQLFESPGALYSAVCELHPSTKEVRPEMVPRSIGVAIRLEAQDAVLQESQSVKVQLRNVTAGIKLSTGKPFHISGSNLEVCPLTRNTTSKVEGQFLYSGSTFGCCDNEQCQNPIEHALYADIEITATDGSVRLLSADITEAIEEAQQTAQIIQINISITRMALQAMVTDWTFGTASGDVLSNND